MTGKNNINQQSVSAVKWSAIGSLAQYGLSLIAQIVLARLLGPDNYGLFAIGVVVLNFSSFLSNFGFAWGLIQIQNLTDREIRFAFTWQFISGCLVGGLLYLFAPQLSSYFNEPRVIPIIRWLSLVCLMSAISAPSNNLLRRDLDFRAINIIQLISYSIGYIFIGIGMAYYGAGVWALVAAWLSQIFIALMLTFIRRPHSIVPLFWYDGAKAMSGVGFTVFVTNLCNWAMDNLDRILLGRFLSAQAVGLYTVGNNLANTPNKLLIGALQPAFLTAGARFQDEPERLRPVFLGVLATVWVVITPLFVLLALLADDLIGFLYGPAWQATANVLFILALSMPVYITWAMSTPILWNTGGKHLESLLQLPILVYACITFYIFAKQGIVAVSVVAASVLLARAIVTTFEACRRLNIKAIQLLPFLARGWAISLLTTYATIAGIELGRMLANLCRSQLPNLMHQASFIKLDFLLRAAEHLLPLIFGGILGCMVLIALLLKYPTLFGRRVLYMLGRFSPKFAHTPA